MFNSRQHNSWLKLSFTVGLVGGLALFISGLVVAIAARHHQLDSTPMRKVNGGTMPYEDGYLMAVFLLLISILFCLDAFRKFRLLRANPESSELADKST
jgi:uncharacterized membrane protein YqhA